MKHRRSNVKYEREGAQKGLNASSGAQFFDILLIASAQSPPTRPQARERGRVGGLWERN